MAVRAKHHALLYLDHQTLLCAYGGASYGEILLRRVTMVEIQHLGPCLSALLAAQFKAAEEVALTLISGSVYLALTDFAFGFIPLHSVSYTRFLKLTERLLRAARLAYSRLTHRRNSSSPVP